MNDMNNNYRTLFRRKPATKAVFFGHQLRLWRDNQRREAIRVWSDGNLLAVLQKDGHIALRGTGIFDDEHNKHARVNVARCLFGLNMTAPEFLAARERERDEHVKARDTETLKDEADRLGFMLVAFDASSKPKGKAAAK